MRSSVERSQLRYLTCSRSIASTPDAVTKYLSLLLTFEEEEKEDEYMTSSLTLDNSNKLFQLYAVSMLLSKIMLVKRKNSHFFNLLTLLKLKLIYVISVGPIRHTTFILGLQIYDVIFCVKINLVIAPKYNKAHKAVSVTELL